MPRILNLFLLAVFVGMGPAGCGGRGFRDAGRAQRLMQLASGEAAQMQAPDQKLASLLNIADLQTDNGHDADALSTLAKARQILTEIAETLEPQTRIAGWVSLSELSYQAGDPDFAGQAIDQAVAALKRLEPPSSRVQFVRGVAAQLHVLRGDAAAANLLVQAGPWIDDNQNSKLLARREALVALASDLFLYNDYDAGLAMLRRDPSPGWRTQVLTQLAERAVPIKSWGKQVDYTSNFRYNSL